MRQADLYIAAMGRSGSTLLANLLTIPTTHWVLVEPRIPWGCRSQSLLHQARRFGLGLTALQWQQDVGVEPGTARFERLFGETLNATQRWGIKEVRPPLHQPTLEAVQPRRVIIQVRRVRDVVISLVNKSRVQGESTYDEGWIFQYVTTAADALARLHAQEGLPSRVVRYEDLVGSEDYRAQLSAWLDWPLTGACDSNLDLYGRGFEVEKHGRQITRNSLESDTSELPDDVEALVHKVSQQTARYESLFYES